MNRLKDILFRLQDYILAEVLRRRYYLSFIREYSFKYPDYLAGRLEICSLDSPYSEDEQRVFTSQIKEFYKDMDKLEYKLFTRKGIDKKLIKFEKYRENV